MKNSILLCVFLCLAQVGLAQTYKGFEKKAAEIAQRIDSIITVEKTALKKELTAIDKKLESKELSREEATAKKKKISESYAEKINTAVFAEEQKLQTLIRNKVNGTLLLDDGVDDKPFFSVFESNNSYNDSITGLKLEKRWTSQFIIALGTNLFEGDDNGSYGDGFKTNLFGYGEVGFSFKYRLKDKSNLWYLKLGFATMVDDIRPDADDDIFVTNDNQTAVQDSGLNIRRAYLGNVYIGLPVHLELDLSKPKFNKDTKQSYFKSQQGFRLGLGGYAAFRISTRQFIRYNDDDGKRISVNQRDNFNVNNFNFGPSAYIGYGDVSLYFKYNVNPLFRNNSEDVNSLAIALRFDFH
jgi:hypothetical protein